MLDDSLEPDIEIIENGPKPRAPSRPWTAHEDALLRVAVAKYGDDTDQWIPIAAEVPGRTNKSCRKRWKHSLSPTLKKTAWTKEEDELLVRLHAEFPCRWSMIAKHISGRTDDACAKRYREALDPSIKQGEWTPEEDRRLLHEYRRWGGRWASVAQQLGRSGLGCRNRWRLLERKKAHTSRSRSSSSSNRDDQQEGISLELASAVSKNEMFESLPQQQPSSKADPPSSTWTDVFTQPQTQQFPQDSSLPSTSQSQLDMTIPIDPSLATFFDNPGESNAQFDARIWDIMNGGCGCGCGSSNMGCGCAEDSVPPFLDISSMDFLAPFQQLSSSQPAPFAPINPNVGLMSSAVGVFPSTNFSSPQTPIQDTARMSQRHESFPPAFANLTQYEHTASTPSSTSATNGMIGQIATSQSPLLQTQSPIQPTSSNKLIPTLSPQTLAMYRDLPPHFANIDPVKFAAAIALARAKDSQQITCKCTGACCADGAGHGSGNENEKPALTVKKSCCEPSTDADDEFYRSMVIPKKRSRSSSSSSSSIPVPTSSCCSSLPVEAGPSMKRSKPSPSSLPPPSVVVPLNTKGKAPLIPRLSSNLEAVPGDSTLLPYACGDHTCWRSDGDVRARFRTSGELLDHWRREHEGNDANAKSTVSDGKVFRCALEGCGKGWKSINGIQYHLQISKAHFSNAINKTVLGVASSEKTPTGSGSCCDGSEQITSDVSVIATGDDLSTSSGVRKRHPCTHPGCPKVYKQAAGLKYHLAHGHPPSGPVQLSDLPPVLYERMAQGARLAATV